MPESSPIEATEVLLDKSYEHHVCRPPKREPFGFLGLRLRRYQPGQIFGCSCGNTYRWQFKQECWCCRQDSDGRQSGSFFTTGWMWVEVRREGDGWEQCYYPMVLV